MEHDLKILMILGIMDHFDPYTVLLVIATNIQCRDPLYTVLHTWVVQNNVKMLL